MIQVRNISFAYAGNAVLKDVSFDVLSGECVGILGNNGAGKSTLITCLNKIHTPETGSVSIDGRDIMEMGRLETARHISYVAQKNELSSITVFDCVMLGRKPYIKWAVTQQDVDICSEMMDMVGISGFRLRYINELSGGELQKVMLARALVQQPKLLLLDEPTSNLDPKNQYEMIALVQKLAREKQISVLVAIHDLNLALRYCDKFLFLRDGLVYQYGDDAVITEQAIFDIYRIKAAVTEFGGRKIVVIG